MMPAGTPPNAIAYDSGLITVPQMARAGFLVNVLCAVLIVLVMYGIGLWAFGIEIGSSKEIIWQVNGFG